ncbi:PREDICTED: uncharacterized protein LOC109342486 [Lupinus angustifolius]|uniref:uncharacterized protein LOC109342486 n=1 Tax=Lupinus angustifolius TaxID=3871 RepID=UPI00092F2482|nr:PREDICTED: uncharacterized protein LOC109342486 [Lupinus angustifolius]
MTRVTQHVSFSDVKVDVPVLRGDNFKVWKEKNFLYFGWMDIDFAIRKPEPPATTKVSTLDQVNLYEKWEQSNCRCVMFIKTKVSAEIRGSIEQYDNIHLLMKAIDEQFVTSNKALVSTIIMQFLSIKLTVLGGVRDHIMHMRDIVAQLKALEVDMSKTIVVHFILCTLPQ